MPPKPLSKNSPSLTDTLKKWGRRGLLVLLIGELFTLFSALIAFVSSLIAVLVYMAFPQTSKTPQTPQGLPKMPEEELKKLLDAINEDEFQQVKDIVKNTKYDITTQFEMYIDNAHSVLMKSDAYQYALIHGNRKIVNVLFYTGMFDKNNNQYIKS